MPKLDGIRVALRQWLPQRGKRGLKSAQLQLLTTYLSTMLGCGMDLVQALCVLSDSGELAIQICAAQLVRDIESGMRFSQAMSRQPETFSSAYRRVIETAEQTGRLGDTLARLGVTLERQAQTARRIKGALVYPICLLASSLLLVSGMLYFVFPMLIHVTQDAGVDPPPVTQFLIVVASKKAALVLVLATLVLSIIIAHIWNHPRWGPPLQRFTELRTPPGRFLTRARLLSTIRQLAMMLESGVDLLRSIQYSGNVGEASLLLREAFEDVYQRVKYGESMTRSMSRHEVFPKALTGMVSVADEVGETHVSLYRFCEMFEDSLNNQLDAATALIEPVLMASMGLVIGFILVAAFLPIYNLVSL